MKINIVNYEMGVIKDGILTKFAKKMNEELIKMGHLSTISGTPDNISHVNHHINFLPYVKGSGVNTLMVTHFLDGEYDRLRILQEGLQTADMGICFSAEMVERFEHAGVDPKKLTYILPAHDGLKRRPTVIAILTKVYTDGRKRAWMLTELSKVIDKDKFAFRIMGQGWRPVVEEMIKDGWKNIEYFEDFDYSIHKAILDSSDYLLYTGNEDEGAMSVLDAANAGLRTIAPVQGFHHDIGIDHPFETQDELNAIFAKLSVNKVEDWTWEKYTKQHVELWEKLRK
jgi:hypothetical protein